MKSSIAIRRTRPVKFGLAFTLACCLAACGGGSPEITTQTVAVNGQSPGTSTAGGAVRNDTANTVATEITDRAIRVLPLGDSITMGLGSCSYRTPLVQALSDYAVEFVGKQGVHSSHSSACVQTNFEHEGRSRWRTIDWLESVNGQTLAFGAANFQRADVVLLHIGSNDIFRGELPAFMIAELDQGALRLGE